MPDIAPLKAIRTIKESFSHGLWEMEQGLQNQDTSK